MVSRKYTHLPLVSAGEHLVHIAVVLYLAAARHAAKVDDVHLVLAAGAVAAEEKVACPTINRDLR